ncbi:MAG: hypothetical protein K0Q87_4017 [Neobacillus sp.]|nr:hypothetical protein [Neobacillus sp.]
MILINLYGKIEPIILSEKLGVGISNLYDEWLTGIVDDLKEEMLLREHFLETSKKYNFGDFKVSQYEPEKIVSNANWTDVLDGDVDYYLQEIASNLVRLEVLDFDKSLLQLKNSHLDSPTCEVQYPLKFIRFCHILTTSRSARTHCDNNIPFMTYNPDDFRSKPLILNFASSMINRENDLITYNEKAIQSMKYVGKLIDNFLESDRDFWIFDYIVNSINESEDYNAYYLFKIMSLIEMLIINPNSNGRTHGELERKLPRFLRNELNDYEDRELFCRIARKLRNKIAHGDFEAFQKLLEEYRENFMKNFWYDEFEYSVESWTINSICLSLKSASSEILFEFFSNKEGFKRFQNS